MSITKVNDALASQKSYFEEYNENIATLLAREGELEGITAFLAENANGDADSVNLVAGLLKADADVVKETLRLWQENKAVMEEFADIKGEIESGLTEESSKIIEEMEAALEELEAGSKAAEAGRETIQGFIDGADAMLPQVEAVYAKVAKAALKQLGAVQEYSGGAYSGGNDGAGAYPMIHGSHALGLDYVPFDGYIAELHKGEKILTAAEAATAEYYTVAPYYVAAMAAISAQENAVTMDMSSYGGYGGHSTELQPVSVSVTVRIEGNATQETAERLSQAGDDIAQRVREVLEDVAMDDNRRRYS